MDFIQIKMTNHPSMIGRFFSSVNFITNSDYMRGVTVSINVSL